VGRLAQSVGCGPHGVRGSPCLIWCQTYCCFVAFAASTSLMQAPLPAPLHTHTHTRHATSWNGKGMVRGVWWDRDNAETKHSCQALPPRRVGAGRRASPSPAARRRRRPRPARRRRARCRPAAARAPARPAAARRRTSSTSSWAAPASRASRRSTRSRTLSAGCSAACARSCGARPPSQPQQCQALPETRPLK